MSDTPSKIEKKKTGNAANLTNAGRGRPKGCLNKNTTALKDMILGALNKAGGEEYLLRQAEENPTAFLTIVGKVLPLTLASPDGGPVAFTLNAQDLAL
jgi:hypothetical protein